MARIAMWCPCFVMYNHKQLVIMKKVLLALFALLFGANALIPHVDSPWLDIPLRSIPIGVGALVAVYAMRLSPEFNRAIDKYLRRR